MDAESDGKASEQTSRGLYKAGVFVLGFLVALFIAGFDSFGLDTAGDLRTSEWQSTLVAPLTHANPGKGDALIRTLAGRTPVQQARYAKAQAAVTVLLVDAKARDKLDFDTPYLPYALQAQYLDAILKAHPKAVFFDFIYRRHHGTGASNMAGPEDDAKDLAALVQVLKDNKNKKYGTPVPVYVGPVDDRPELAEFRTLVTPVSVSWRGNDVATYPFVGDDQYNPDGEMPRPALTAAATIYQQLCPKEATPADLDCRLADQISVTAPKRLPPLFMTYDRYAGVDKRYLATPDCVAEKTSARRNGPSGLGAVLADNLMRRAAPTASTKCLPVPYFSLADAAAVHAAAFFTPDDAFLKDEVTGKVVMIGDDLGNDLYDAPAFGQIDGVFQHAVALQHLLADGRDYTRWPQPVEMQLGQGTFSVRVNFFVEWLISLAAAVIAQYWLTVRNRPSKQRGEGWVLAGRLATIFAGTFLVSLAIAALQTFWFHWPPNNSPGVLLSTVTLIGGMEFDRLSSKYRLILGGAGAVLAILSCLWLYSLL